MAKRPGSRPPKSLPKGRPTEPPAVVMPSVGPVSPQPRPAAPPPPPQPAAEALAVFQHGMEAMQRHAYLDASRKFQAILMGFPAERALVDRAKVYLAICERELERKPAGPRTTEERLTAATAALNNGDDEKAAELARSVLGDDPKHDLALYLLAAVQARRGDHDEALSLLAKVLALTPEASAQARADADFAGLHDLEAFWKLTEPPAHETRPRRGRTPRSDR